MLKQELPVRGREQIEKKEKGTWVLLAKMKQSGSVLHL